MKKLLLVMVLLFGGTAIGQTLATMTVSPTTARITSGTQVFTVTCRDTGGSVMACPALTCGSRMTSVATITNSGSACVATAVANGTAPLYVYVSGSHTGAGGDDTVGQTMVLTVGTPTYNVSTTPTHASYSLPTQPAKGASVADPAFGTTLSRVTSSNADSGNFATITEYATFDARSSDGQYLIGQPCSGQNQYWSLSGGCSPNAAIYNAVTFGYTKNVAILAWDSNAPEPRWNSPSLPGLGITSAVPHAFTYRKHMQLRQVNVDTGVDTLVHDFCNDFGPTGTVHALPAHPCATDAALGWFIFRNEYGSPSDNGRYDAFLVRNSGAGGTFEYALAIVYDRVTDTAVSWHDISGCATAGPGASSVCPKGILMSPSGNYLIVNYFSNSPPYVTPPCNPNTAAQFAGQIAYSRDFSSCVQVSSYPEHINYAYTKQGDEVSWGFTQGSPNGLTYTKLSDGTTYFLYDWTSYDWPATLFPQHGANGWGFFQTYTTFNLDCIGDGKCPSWLAESENGSGRIAAAELDTTKCVHYYPSWKDYYNTTNQQNCAGPPRFWQIASTFNNYYNPPDNAYFTQVNLQVDHFTNGQYFWWGSNWGNGGTNPGEIYQGTLPANWLTDLSGAVVTSCTLSPSSATIATGGTQAATATCMYSDGSGPTSCTSDLSLGTSNAGVASVSSQTITGVAAGSATITGTTISNSTVCSPTMSVTVTQSPHFSVKGGVTFSGGIAIK